MFLHYLAKLETQKLYHFRLQCVHRLQRRGARYQCSMACVSICLLDTTVSPAKTDEPIVVPFGLWTPVGQPNHALVGGPDPQGRTIFRDVLLRWKCIVTASAENGYINCTTYDMIRYDIRSYFNVRSKADISQFNLRHCRHTHLTASFPGQPG